MEISKFNNGKHTLSAKAYDAAGNVGSSSNVTVKVPTKITIVNLAEGSTIVGNVA